MTFGPQLNYGTDPRLPGVVFTVTRRMEGTAYVEWEVANHVGLDVEYNAYKLVRKVFEYPRTDTDGYLLDSGAVNVLGTSGTYEDVIADEEGQIVYYALFCRRVADSLYYCVAADYCMRTQLHHDDVTSSLYPMSFQIDQPLVDFSNPTAFLRCLLEPVFGEVEALIRCLPREFDIRLASPKALDGLGSAYGWNLSPLLDLEDFRTQLEALPANLRKKGQTDICIELIEGVSGMEVGIQHWIECQDVSLDHNEEEFMWNFALDVAGVGDNVTTNFVFTPLQDIEPATVRVYDDSGTQVIVDDGEGALYLESNPAVACGTVVYEGALRTIDATFPVAPVLGDTVWAYHLFRSWDWGIADVEAITRYGYVGDRVKRAQSRRERLSAAAVAVFLYLNLEVGEEGVTDFPRDEYLKLYVDDVKKKLRRFWPLFGVSDFYITDRIVITASADDYAAHLPLEEGCGRMRDRGR